MADRISLPVADNYMDSLNLDDDEFATLIDDVNVEQKEKFSLRLLFQNEQPPGIITGRKVKAVVDCLKRMNFLDFHDCRNLARNDDDYYGICIFTINPFETKDIIIESGDIFLANTDAGGEKFVVDKNNTAHGQTFRKIFDDNNLRRKHIFMGFAQHKKWLIGRSGTFNSELFTNLLPLSDAEKRKEGLFIFRTLIYGSIIMFKLSHHPTMSPYASAMGICLFLLETKVGTERQKQNLPIIDISIDYSDVFMTQMFLGLDIHPTILAILYQNKIRGKVISEALNLLFEQLCSKATDFTSDQYENMLNELKTWVGNEKDDTSTQLRELIESSKNKYADRKAATRYHYDGREINMNEWLEKLQSGWIYSGETYKRDKNDGVCDRCGQSNLLYEFIIRNEYTNSTEVIGSECVKRFNFSIMDENQNPIIKKEEIGKKIDKDKRKLIKSEIQKRRLIALVALEYARKQKDPEFMIDFDNYIDYAIKHDGFTPKMIHVLSWKLKEYGITHKPEDFKMLLTKKRYKEDLLGIKNKQQWLLRQMLPYMTKQQKDSIGVS